MRWPSTQTINEKSTNPNGINNALFDLLSKLNTTYQELSNVPRVVDSDTYGRYREYPDGTTQGRYLFSGILRSAATALVTNTSVNIGTIVIPANSIWQVSGMGGWVLAATTTVTNYALSVSKTSATLSGADTISYPTNGEVRYQFDGAGTIQLGGTFTASIPSFRYENDTNADVTLYLVLRCIFGVSTVSGYGSFQAGSIL